MRLIRTHSDYAHIRFRIRICMYPNIFAYADIRPHIYPIPKSAWEKIRMANSNDNVLIGVGKEGRGDGNSHQTTCLTLLSNHLSLRCSIAMKRKSLQFQLLEIFIWRHRLNWKSANFQFLHRSCEHSTHFRTESES